MTPHDAAKLLEIAPDATPEQAEVRFRELRAKLEDKIAKAPTPGLKEKYRASLAEVTTAFEVFVIAADSALLPVLQADPPPPPVPPVAASSGVAAAVPTSPPTARHHVAVAPRRSREFVWVMLLAVVVLGAGGWWVLQTRAENTRRAAEAARAAAAEKEAAQAEQQRQEALLARLRTQLAEGRLTWESFEKEERNAERALSDYKSEARNTRELPAAKINEYTARVAVTQRYLTWLRTKLDRHPAAVARVKVEELLAARRPDEAAAELRTMELELSRLGSEIAAQKALLDRLDGSLEVSSTPAGLAFTVVDGFGRTHRGTTPGRVNGVAPGPCTVTLSRQGFADEQVSASVEPGVVSQARHTVTSETVVLNAEPDVEFWSNGRFLTRGQFVFTDYPPGKYAIELRRANTQSLAMTVEVVQGKTTRTLNYNLSQLATQNIRCDDCEARGYHDEARSCSACDGHGSFGCRVCGGDGITVVVNGVAFPCVECAGRGNIRCKSCRGEGEIVHRTRCARCGGDGWMSAIDAGRTEE